MKRPKLCKRHPTYQAKRPPRSKCFDCWHAWRSLDWASDVLVAAAEIYSHYYGHPVTVEVQFPGGGRRVEMESTK